MKRTILIIAALAFATTATFTGCTTPAEKVENAEENVEQANEALAKAKQEYLADLESFKKQTENQTITNEQMIAELKARVANEKMEARAAFNKRISELEQKNLEMKKKISNYKDDSLDSWESFKAEFSRDMDELGKALKDFFVTK